MEKIEEYIEDLKDIASIGACYVFKDKLDFVKVPGNIHLETIDKVINIMEEKLDNSKFITSVQTSIEERLNHLKEKIESESDPFKKLAWKERCSEIEDFVLRVFTEEFQNPKYVQKGKMGRPSLNDEIKEKIIQHKKDFPSKSLSNISEFFNIPRSTVGDILKKAAEEPESDIEKGHQFACNRCEEMFSNNLVSEFAGFLYCEECLKIEQCDHDATFDGVCNTCGLEGLEELDKEIENQCIATAGHGGRCMNENSGVSEYCITHHHKQSRDSKKEIKEIDIKEKNCIAISKYSNEQCVNFRNFGDYCGSHKHLDKKEEIAPEVKELTKDLEEEGVFNEDSNESDISTDISTDEDKHINTLTYKEVTKEIIDEAMAIKKDIPNVPVSYIAKHFGVAYPTLFKKMKDEGLKSQINPANKQQRNDAKNVFRRRMEDEAINGSLDKPKLGRPAVTEEQKTNVIWFRENTEKTLDEIGEEVGLSRVSVSRVLTEAEVIKYPKTVPQGEALTEDEQKQIKELYAEGSPYFKIAELINRPRKTVESFIRRNNLYNPKEEQEVRREESHDSEKQQNVDLPETEDSQDRAFKELARDFDMEVITLKRFLEYYKIKGDKITKFDVEVALPNVNDAEAFLESLTTKIKRMYPGYKGKINQEKTEVKFIVL